MEDNKEKNNAINGGCSIHTFEMCITPTAETLGLYLDILKTRFKYNAGRSYQDNEEYRKKENLRYAAPVYLARYRCYDNDELFEHGLSFFCLKETIRVEGFSKEVIYRDIMFQVNPRILLGHSEYKYICIVPQNEIELIVDRLVEILKPLGFLESDIRFAVITRLDVCTNITLDSQEEARAYLKCLRKGGYYKRLYLKDKRFSETAHRYVYLNNEVKFVSRDPKPQRIRQEISIYTKHDQMENSEKGYDEDEIITAEGQIRFEFRLFRRKINYLLEKYRCNVEFELVLMSEAIGVDELLDRLAGLYGTGKMLKKEAAVSKIDKSTHRLSVRNVMKRIIEDTRKNNMVYAFDEYGGDKSRIMSYFNQLGISPITIPASWEIEEFENPLTYIKTRNVNERELE